MTNEKKLPKLPKCAGALLLGIFLNPNFAVTMHHFELTCKKQRSKSNTILCSTVLTLECGNKEYTRILK